MRGADERLSVAVSGGSIPVEVFKPDGPGPWPGVVVIHEIFGLNDDIRRIARRFAAEGYLAAAPDLLSGGLHVLCVASAIRALQAGSGGAVEGLERLIAQLARRADVGKVGAVGFCMGGGFALLLGTRERVSAAGVYYGDTRPREELRRVCPVMGGYGGKDRIFASKGRRLVADLEALGKEHDVRIYEDAGHSFMNDAGRPFLAWLSRPLLQVRYDPDAAEDAWRRMLAFFEKHLRGAERTVESRA